MVTSTMKIIVVTLDSHVIPRGSLRIIYHINMIRQGRLLETVQYASGGHVIETSVFDYGEGSDPVQVITTDAKGCVENTIHQYDEKGSRIETTIFDQNDEIKTVEKFQYYEDRQLISRWLYNTKGELYSYWIYGYDAIGRRIEENLYTAQKGLEMKWLYQYNERGDVVEETIHGAKKARISKEIYIYKYDDCGNWTVKVTYSFLLRKGQYTPIPIKGEYRIIRYYDE